MSALRDKVINGIIAVEGGYVNDPRDSGGETNWGITVAVARADGYTGPMRDLPKQRAYDIYARKYWHALKLDDVEKLAPRVAEEMADTGVNCGVSVSGTFLQRALNVLNNRGTLWPDLKIDGQIGPATLRALTAYLKYRGKAEGEVVLLRMLNSLQGARYIELAEKREKDERFVYGWFLHRVS